MPEIDRTIWLDQGWQPVAIGFYPTRKAWEREMKRLKVKPEAYPFDSPVNGDAHWLENGTTGEAVILIGVNEELIGDDPTTLICVLVHEATHVFDWICEHMGENEPGGEMRAYAMQHIVRGLLNAYSATLGRDKKWP